MTNRLWSKFVCFFYGHKDIHLNGGYTNGFGYLNVRCDRCERVDSYLWRSKST